MALTLVVGTNTYLTLADAKTYLEGGIHASAFMNAEIADQNKALVTATRMFERVMWRGTKTSDAQTLSWPRTGVTDKYGNAVSSGSVPQIIKDAQCELALALIEDSALQNKASTAAQQKSVTAGSVSVEFFKTPNGAATRFPLPVHELISQFIGEGDLSGAGAVSYGTDNESSFDSDDSYGINSGF